VPDSLARKIMTVRELQQAIRTCESVYARVDFANNEEYFKIRKVDALFLVSRLAPTATPDDYGMLENNRLSLW